MNLLPDHYPVPSERQRLRFLSQHPHYLVRKLYWRIYGIVHRWPTWRVCPNHADCWCGPGGSWAGFRHS